MGKSPGSLLPEPLNRERWHGLRQALGSAMWRHTAGVVDATVNVALASDLSVRLEVVRVEDRVGHDELAHHGGILLRIFADGDELRFSDIRRFGRIALLDDADLEGRFRDLGPEPLDGDFTPDLFAARVAERRGNVKAALLDQRLVAGLGNIYADEALFRARVHPRRTLASLSAAEIGALHGAIVSVLTQALGQGGTSFSDYRTTWGRLGGYQNELSVFRKAGSPCPVCSTPIERAVVAGRGTYYCPGCQTSGG